MIIPAKIILSPTSIPPCRTYMSRILTEGKKHFRVITSITLEGRENKEGIAYAVAKFKDLRSVTAEEEESIAKLIALAKQTLVEHPIEDDEYKSKDSEEVPF